MFMCVNVQKHYCSIDVIYDSQSGLYKDNDNLFFPLVSHKSGVCYDLTRQKKKICNNLSSYCN